jgi:hypothetical protein
MEMLVLTKRPKDSDKRLSLMRIERDMNLRYCKERLSWKRRDKDRKLSDFIMRRRP